jgi:hypothetical protein
MITKGTNEVADVLLNVFLAGDPRPQWKKLPRPVKRELMNRLGEKNYNNIHDPRLYQDLDRLWNARRKLKEEDIVDRAKLATKVECAVCLETYDGGDKVTTLMCGHKFCSKCILNHMHRLGEYAACPLCRRNVFDLDTPSTSSLTSVSRISEDDLTSVVLLDRLRKKRQLERMKKRQRKRESKK